MGFGGLYSYHSRQPWLNKNSDGWLNHQLHWARSLAPGIRGTEDEITWMIFPLLFKSPDEKLREQWQHVCFNHNGTTRGILFTVLGGEIDQTSFMGLDHAWCILRCCRGMINTLNIPAQSKWIENVDWDWFGYMESEAGFNMYQDSSNLSGDILDEFPERWFFDDAFTCFDSIFLGVCWFREMCYITSLPTDMLHYASRFAAHSTTWIVRLMTTVRYACPNHGIPCKK